MLEIETRPLVHGSIVPHAADSLTVPAPRSRVALPVAIMALAACVGDVASIIAAEHLAAVFGQNDHIRHILPVIVICYSVLAHVSGAYDVDSLFFFKRAWPRVANAWASAVVGIAALVSALDIATMVQIRGLAIWFAIGLIAVGSTRAILVLSARRMKRAGVFNGRIAIVGIGVQATELADYVLRTDDLAVSLVGFYGDRAPDSGEIDMLRLPYLGELSALVAAVRAGAIDKVFVALPWSDQSRLQSVVEHLSSTPVEIRLAPDRAGFAYARRTVTSLGGLSIIALADQPLSVVQQALKATEDRVVAMIALVLLSPVMVLAAVAIRLTSPGPLLFRQSREGFNCKPFEILKFRTMHTDAARAGAIVQAVRGDPRVTRVGAVLRRTSIDELPQLFNVLVGNMSLVGPRPHSPSTRAGGRLFADVAQSYAARHNVKPGLTGWAQVCGWRGETTTEEKLIRRLEHDMYYIAHWSIWFDLYIIARTAVTVLAQRNAY